MRYLSANQFEVYEEIGKGGFGVVYRGLDKVTKEQVAIKQIDLESQDSLEDLQKEINILSQCKLKQITRYHGCFVKGYKMWIIMEYLDGGSCMDLLRPGPIAEKYIAILLRELLVALCYLHENSRIHRDVKAANILLNTLGDVKIADFGVSTQLSNNLSKRNTFVGSPYWMSPEVIKEEEYNFKADIWSLGITAIEMAIGKPPLSSIPPMKVLFQIPENDPPRLEDSDFSSDFKDFVKMCLQKNPNNRPTAKKLLNSKFISKAGYNSTLKDLIKRRQVWEVTQDYRKKKPKTYYVPTIDTLHLKKDKENDISFDFEDSYIDKGNVSDVVIANRSPLKYSTRDNSIIKAADNGLKTNKNLLNTLDIKLVQKNVPSVYGSNISTMRPGNLNRLKPKLSRSNVHKAFDDALQRLTCHDDIQKVKLEQIKSLFDELDDNVLVQFSSEFSRGLIFHSTEKEESKEPKPSNGARLHSKSCGEYITGQRDQVVMSSAIKEVSERPSLQPRKAESEKLLLKRWADQYFS